MGSILRLQDGISDLKNLDFAADIHRIRQDRFFIRQDGLDSFLDLSWASFASFGGSLGRPLGALEGLLGDFWGPQNADRSDE